AEVDIGPRFPVGEFSEGMSIRPYAIGTALGLGNSLYFAGPGLGGNFTARLLPSLSLSSTLEARGLQFNNFASEPTATDKNAVQMIGRTELNYALAASDLISGTVQATGYVARRNFETYAQLTLAATYVHRFE